MRHLLGAQSVHVEFPTQVVLGGLTVGINEGDRIGVVGRNGDGKSTLIRVLAGALTPDSGEVISRSGVRIGMLNQGEDIPDHTTIKDAVVGERADHEWARDPKIRDVIAGLLSDVAWEARVGDLSGGQRRRVSLAALLVNEWDVLFLDEPTNHLDVMGVSWLARHLASRWARNSGALVVVTHDRWFLDAATDTTWEVHDGIVDAYDGGYAAYILQSVERKRSAAIAEAKRQNLLKKELAWLRRGAPARTSKPKFRIDAATALINDVPVIRDPVSLARVASARLGKKVIELEEVSLSYGENEILKTFTWRLAPGERTGILGANGAGKSTLLGLIAGTIQPTSGEVYTGATVKLSILDQRLESLDQVMNDRVSEVIARKKTTYRADGVEMTPGQLLERLGFSSAHLSARVFELSGGQRRRLQFLLELLEEPNVLLLDEPTNDLDTDMLRAMEDLLDTWPGTLIVVSHDRYLLERITDQQYAVLDGFVQHVPGGIEEYLRLENSLEATGFPRHSTPLQPAADNAEKPRAGSKEHRELEKERRAIDKKIRELAAQIRDIDAALARADQADYESLSELTRARQEVQGELDTCEERWLELEELVS